MAAGRKRQVEGNQITLQLTTVFEKNCAAYLDPKKRRALNSGGTSSSKTISILQLLFYICMAAERKKEKMLISVVSESLPHLRLGCIRDWFKILNTNEDDPRWSKTTFTFRANDYAQVEFFGADDVGKAHGPRRTILFVNEGNNVPWETVRALDVRTEKFTFVDWNPVGEFWAYNYEDGEGNQVPGWWYDPSTAQIESTYLDALPVLPPDVVANIESYRDKDPNWWHVYGEGKLGKIEGRVYPSFQQVDALPDMPTGYGLDFGFSGDPVALTSHYVQGDRLYSRQLIYKRGLTNDVLAREMDLIGVSHSLPIYADAAEPKSIQELRDKGFNVVPAEKGAGSVEYGIQKVNQFIQYWTKDSLDAIREQRNFTWDRDRITGRFKNTANNAHQYSHALDSRRYYCSSFRLNNNTGQAIQTLHFGGRSSRFRAGRRIYA